MTIISTTSDVIDNDLDHGIAIQKAITHTCYRQPLKNEALLPILNDNDLAIPC